MTASSNFEVVQTNRRDRLGEGPLWSARDQALYWVDILSCCVHQLDLVDLRVRTWRLPDKVGWLCERDDAPGFIAGMADGFYEMTLDPLVLRAIGDPEPELPGNRLNDGKADRFGAIWAGTMAMNESDAAGSLYRLAPDLSWSRADTGYIVANGPAFSPDGNVLYHTDSAQGRVYRFEMDDEGRLGGRRLFVEFPASWGSPDGMTTDELGGLWIAHWGGSRVSRFTPEGELERAIYLPASQITSCAFAGPDLDRLFVTSAAVDKPDEPLAGCLFEVETSVRGLPPNRFAG